MCVVLVIDDISEKIEDVWHAPSLCARPVSTNYKLFTTHYLYVKCKQDDHYRVFMQTCAIKFEEKLHGNEFEYVQTQRIGLYQTIGPVLR